MAKCAYHAEVDAVAACSNCGRLVCPECKVVLGEKIYCNPCAEEILLAKAQVSESKPEKDTTVVAKAQVVESEPEKVTVTEEKVSAPEISSEIPKVSSKIPKVIRETSVITWTGKWRLWQILGILFLAASVISLFALLINLEPEPGHSKLVSSQTVNTLQFNRLGNRPPFTFPYQPGGTVSKKIYPAHSRCTAVLMVHRTSGIRGQS